MKALLTCAAFVVAALLFTDSAQAGNFRGGGFYSGLPYHGFGYSGSLYGLGYVPVPPYFALHPPVYYSHEIRRRPIGDSPYAYPPQRPIAQPKPQFSLNPFVPRTIIDDGSKQTSQATDPVATVMPNPFYGNNNEQLASSKLIYNPYYTKGAAAVAQAAN